MLAPLTLLLQINAARPVNCDVRSNGDFCQSVAADFQTPCLRYQTTLPAGVTQRLATERAADKLAHRTGSLDDWLTLACTDVALHFMYSNGTPQESFALSHRHPFWYELAIMAALPAAHLAADSTHIAIGLLSSLLIWAAPARADPRYVDASTMVTLGGRPEQKALTRYVEQTLPLLVSATTRHSSDSRMLRACTSLTLDAHEYTTAHRCAFQAAIDRHDATWMLLRLAWLAFHQADTTGGARAFRKAVAAAANPADRPDLGWHFETGTNPWQEWGTSAIPDTAAPQEFARQRIAWLAMPLGSLMRWVADDSLPSDEWMPLATPAQLAEHFTQLAFVGELFRHCVEGEREQPCAGKVPEALYARRLRLWSSDDSAIVVIPYHMMIDVKGAATGAMLRLRQWNLAGQIRDDSAMAHVEGKLLEGLLVAPADPALNSWTLDFDAPEPAPGAFQDFQAPLDSGALVASDLFLGAPDSRLHWQHGGVDIPVATTDTFDRRQTVTLYFQARCPSRCGDITRSIRIYRLPDRVRATPSIAVTTTMPTRVGVTEVSTELDLSRLAAGVYRLEVELHSDAVHATARRATNLVIR